MTGSFSDYAAIEAVNWSTLKHMLESPLHYRHALQSRRADTPALARGRLSHLLLFEPDSFGETYAVWDGDRRGADYRAFVAANADREIVKPADVDAAQAIADALRANPIVRHHLAGALHEVTLRWTDPDTGLACKARSDWLQPSSRTLLDLKTARNIDRRVFSRQAAQLGYHCQLAHYAAGVEHALGWAPTTLLIVAVESAPPHDVAVFEPDGPAMDLARETVAALLARVKECRESGEWPGRYPTVEPLDLPGWMFGDGDPTMTFEAQDP